MAASVQSYIPSFSKKITALNTGKLALAPYPLSYLQLLLKHHLYYLHIYAHVVDKLLENSDKAKSEMSLIDYGAGNGLLGMFAKHCGFGKVYLVDRSALFMDAALQLATYLDVFIDGYVAGDLNAVADFFEKKKMPDAIIGTDVIEHIYNPEEFFAGIHLLNPDMVSVFTTASVTSNPFKTKQLMRLQYKDELYGSNPEHAMPGDEYAGLPFVEIRKRIIRKSQPQLSDDALDRIASATRGMNKEDIISAAEKFIKEGIMPSPSAHPTNTCDPVTGSWTERLLTAKEYEHIYNQAGFSLSTYTGFYNQWQSGPKSIALGLLNKAMVLLGRRGNFMTPFITLIGKKR